MGLLENLRQWTSERIDDMLDQDNTYHSSSGKTQKEYANDLKTLQDLETAAKVGTVALGAAGGGALGAEILGASPILGAAVGARRGGALAPGTAALLGGALGTKLGAVALGDAPLFGGAYGTDVVRKSTNLRDPSSAEAEPAATDETAEEATEEAKSPEYDIDEMAGEFILGAWGNGQDRIDNMLNAGYTIDDYNAIQQRVNDAYASGRDLHEWTNKANAKLHYW